MTNVAIVPIQTERGRTAYHAVAGAKHSSGASMGAALDALTAQFSGDELGTLVLVQRFQSDQLFTAAQQQRLEHLMTRWRTVRDQSQALSPGEQAELAALVEAELSAATLRASILADTAGL
jgi:hypothetical protein